MESTTFLQAYWLTAAPTTLYRSDRNNLQFLSLQVFRGDSQISNLHKENKRYYSLRSISIDGSADWETETTTETVHKGTTSEGSAAKLTHGVNNNDDNGELDAPRPTANGGFTHTKTSKAKISAANKGKVPWNKGQPRSDAVKARIAAGVKARNRQKFLEQLATEGVTEEEYNAKQEAERLEKEQKQQARRTAAGGYRPTDETKQKISRILKQKYAAKDDAGRPRRRPPQKIRRGFVHSEETRRKISETLRQRWALDAEYRAKMVQSSHSVNTMDSVRQKISASLRAKWQDPSFRAQMIENMARKRALASNDNSSSYNNQKSSSARQKISEAIKAKWQDAEYREKIRLGMLNKRNAAAKNATSATSKSPRPSRVVSSGTKKKDDAQLTRSAAVVEVQPRVVGDGTVTATAPWLSHGIVRPAQPRTEPRTATLKNKRVAPAKPKQTASRNINKSVVSSLLHDDSGDLDPLDKDIVDDSLVDSATGISSPKPLTNRRGTKNPKSTSKNSGGADHKSAAASATNGNVDLLKEERRDLYDFLYGDETEEPRIVDPIVDVNGNTNSLDPLTPVRRGGGRKSSKLASVFALEEEDDEDDNLDNFDPYGLDDF